MNVDELPMILFTVFAQMSVGAFIVLGAIHVVALLSGYNNEEIDAISDPAVYAIGVTLVLGLTASIFHMHDMLNVLNVFRHLDSSWLSREVLFGVLFAGAGFVFAACQWFKWGTPALRSALAVVTALLGVGLVWSMSMIYYSLVTVPAWNTWNTPARFFITALLLGGLAVGTAFMTQVMLRRRAKPAGDDTVSESPRVRKLILGSLTGIAVLEVLLVGLVFVITPMHVASLANQGGVGQESLAALSGAAYVVRLILVFVGGALLALFLFRLAARESTAPKPLAALVTSAFVCVLVAEVMGRAAFYESMTRIGM